MMPPAEQMASHALVRCRGWLAKRSWPAAAADPLCAVQRSVGIWLSDTATGASAAGGTNAELSVIEALAEIGTADPVVMNRLCLRVLSAIQAPPGSDGWAPHGQPPTIDMLRPLNALRGDPAVLLQAAAQVCSETAFGASRARMPASAHSAWSAVLPTALAVAVRAGDLDVTSALLRANLFLGITDHTVTRGASAFLSAQQQPDGGYGAAGGENGDERGVAVRLPLAVSCTWTLAEVVRPGLTAEVFTRARCSDMEDGSERSAPAAPRILRLHRPTKEQND